MLLGYLPDLEIARQFAFQKNRVNDFSVEREQTPDVEFRNKYPLFMTALMADLQNCSEPYPANPSFNREIASGVLACFPADRFDSTGLPKSAEMLWMEKHSLDSQLLVDHLIQMGFRDRTGNQSASRLNKRRT